jgi:hypothetical protein
LSNITLAASGATSTTTVFLRLLLLSPGCPTKIPPIFGIHSQRALPSGPKLELAMLVNDKALIVALTVFFTQSHAAALEPREPTFPILHRSYVEAADATLTWFGDFKPVPRGVAGSELRDGAGSPALSPRGLPPAGCGTNTIKCSTGHPYEGALCASLIKVLNTEVTVSQSPRAVCLGQASRSCCISWSAPIANPQWNRLQQRDLIPSANRTLMSCGGGYQRSGQEWNVNLRETCVSQCLSNRPDGCKA